MDQALLTFRNELPYNISVYYTSDYCYKVFQIYFFLVTYECLKHFMYSQKYK